MFERLSAVVGSHARLVLVGAVILVAIAGFFAPQTLRKLSQDGFVSADAESTQATQAINRQFAKDTTSAIILFQHRDGKEATDPAYRAAVEEVLQAARDHEQAVSKISNYYNTGSDTFISKDKKSTFALITIDGSKEEQGEIAARLRDHLSHEDLSLSYGGAALLNHDVLEIIEEDLTRAEIISFSLLAILLFFVFRSVVAALLPLLLGGFTIVCSLWALQLMTEVTVIVQYALNVIMLVGLGLAVDYSLLIISRFREELAKHKGEVVPALAVTMRTAGRTVFFSGLTVIMSLASLLIFPIAFLRSMGLGGGVAVLLAMVAALVILPALLRLLGRRINWLSFGAVHRAELAMERGEVAAEAESIWHKSGAFFMRRAGLTVVITLALLVTAGLPFLHAKLTSPDHTVLPPNSEGRQTTEALRQDFTFSAAPIQIVYTTQRDSITSADALDELRDYVEDIEAIEGVREVQSLVTLPGMQLPQAQYDALLRLPESQRPAALNDQLERIMAEQATLITVSYTGTSMTPVTQDIVRDIRALDTPSGATQVGGVTAELVDQLEVLRQYVPIALLLIGVTLFTLLFLMLGSVVIPLKAMIQNVLSLGASFGALVWIFQDEVFKGIIPFNTAGSVDSTQPVLIFAIAFGLSMDYSVFLYSRIKEQYDKSGDTSEAVLSGLQKTGSIITSAAVLLVVVVVAFAAGRISIMQQVGVGLATAIVVDAFIVRMLLVPATMKLLGRWNWWAPRPLQWLHERLGMGERS